MTDYRQCNLYNKEFKKDFGDSENPINHPTKWWEIWKGGGDIYEVPTHLEVVEKLFLPKLISKPTEYNKLKTIISKAREVEKELMKPKVEKLEEVLWKFFYKKGKMMPYFIYGDAHSSTWDICETCNSELENLIKLHAIDEIENERIASKFEKVGGKEMGEIIKNIPFSDSENEEIGKEKEKLYEEFLKNKEKELNNKMLAERERERERMGRIRIELHGLSLVLA